MPTSRIDAIIDDVKETYAYTWLERSHGYGHMIVKIYMPGIEWHGRKGGCIKISCQIGRGNEFGTPEFHKPYAQRYGFDPGYGDGTLVELEQAVKYLRKIQKALDKQYQTLGEPNSYAELCQRILAGAGIRWLISEKWDGWNNGGAMRDKDLCEVGPSSARRLAQMEDTLIAAFNKNAA